MSGSSREGRVRALSLMEDSPTNYYSAHSLSSGLRQVVRLAFPNVASFVVVYISTVVTALCVSRLDRAELLASVGLGNLLANMLGYSIGTGLMSVLDTVISQSAGSGNDHLSVVHLTRGRLTCLVVVFPCTLALLFSGKILLFFGQDSVTSYYAEQFMTWTSIGLLPFFLFLADCSYLRAHHVNNPQLLVNCVCALVQLILCVFFVNFMNMEMRGAGLSLSIAHWLRWMLLQSYVHSGRLDKTLQDGCSFTAFLQELRDEFGLSKTSGRAPVPSRSSSNGRSVYCPETGVFAGLRDFLWLQINSAMTMWIEWWLYEVLALIAGTLGVNVLAAHVVCVTIETIVFMVPLGFQQATSVLVGNSLGAGKPRKASHYGKLCVAVSMCMNVPIGILIFRYRDALSRTYTSDEEVLKLLEPALKLISVFQAIDGLNCVLEGVLRGIRLQEKAVTAKASVMFFLQLPLSYYLAHKIGLIGIWLAASIGFGLSCLIYATIILRADFNKCSLEAMKEARQQAGLLRDYA